AASVVGFYREALGRILFEDVGFFTGDPVCSLRVLQERGRDALEGHDIPGIGRVWMTECLWERGDRDLLHIRSADCFRHIEELHLPLGEGELLQAKLKVSVAGKSTRPVTVNIRVPSRIEVSQRRHEPQIERLLTRIGIHDPGARSARSDLWSLYPWRLSREEWRSAFGRETDALIERRVLVPVRLHAVRSASEPAAGRALRAHEVSDGEYYAVSIMPGVPSRSVTPTDLDGFELNPERLREELRSRLGITGAALAWDGRGEVLDLGEIELGDHRLRLSYALRAPQNGVGSTLRSGAGGAHPVLLVPSHGPRGNLDLPVAPVESPLPSRKDAIRAAIAAAGLTHVVPAEFSAPDGVTLVVDSQHGVIWFDGIKIPELKPGTHPFRFVELLARRSPDAVSKKALTADLSGARDDGDTVVRQAKFKACGLIRQALARVGRSLDGDPFPTAGVGAYRCALASYVV
ncbi:MAG TPA: hypothetical protein VFR37_00550, partial [Longimicrobium sp.]|nr:hypothetical protein [Longimicrobium sp.]